MIYTVNWFQYISICVNTYDTAMNVTDKYCKGVIGCDCGKFSIDVTCLHVFNYLVLVRPARICDIDKYVIPIIILVIVTYVIIISY